MAGLRHIIGNLASNALKYSDAASPVEIVVRKEGDVVKLAFHDHGIGIPPDELESIFERFRRASNARSSKIRGTGLGLYFVKQLVERGNGSIAIESTLKGGTTVTVTLPLRNEAALDAAMIVSVEADGDDRSLIASELRKNGYAVRAVQTVAAARDALRHERVGLAIVDADVLGEDELAALRADCRAGDLPVLTTGAQRDTAQPLELRKPFVTGDLLLKVAAIIPAVAL